MRRTPIRAVCFSVLTLACVLDVLVAAQTATLPFLGRWKFNPAKSDLQTTRLVFTQAGSGEMTMTMAGTSYSFRVDGTERPSPLESTATWTQTGPRTWRTVYRLAKTDNNIDNYTLSEDGKTLTMKTDYLVPKRFEQTIVFSRASGGPGLAGVWLTKTVQTESWLEMSSGDGRTVNVSWPSFGGSAVLSTDGRESPVTGPPTAVPPGMTASLKTTGPRTFDLAMKLKGVNVTTGHFTVAADGKSMSAETVSGPPGPTEERSKSFFERQ
jgi:hypothetical protein